MNPEPNPSAPSAPQPCRWTVVIVLVSLLMMCLGNGLFLWNEIRQKNSDVVLAEKIVKDYQVNNAPRIQEFLAGLQVFSKSHPDFQPILAKYNLVASPAGSPVPVATPPPAAPAKK